MFKIYLLKKKAYDLILYTDFHIFQMTQGDQYRIL